MPEQLVLTFAEIEFLLRASSDQAEAVRQHLRINPEAATDIVVAAGVAALLARGLCTMSGPEVVPTAPIVAVTAGLAASAMHTEAVGWIDGRPVVMHLFSGESVRLAVFPAAYGQFSVELLNPAEPLLAPLTRFLDSCTAGDGEAAVAVRSATGSADYVSAAIARDAAGTWYLSDSLDHPDRGTPTTHDGILRRLAELFGPRPVGVRG